MERKEILEKLKPVFAWQLGVSEDDIKEDAKYAEDLGADEMDIMILTSDVEETFGMPFNENRLFYPSINVCTIGDSINYIQSRLERK